MENRILEYLSRRAATPEHLERHINATAQDVQEALHALQAKSWVTIGAAWYGDDPSTGITVVTLSSKGRVEMKRRQAELTDEPIEMTRAELISELRRLGLTDEQIALNPNLRAERFHYWPSITAYSILPD